MMRVLLFFLFCFIERCVCYKPVILMHGILAKSDELKDMEDLILQAHPGTDVLRIQAYDDVFSLLPMWKQTNYIVPIVQDFMNKHSATGVHMLGFSQGGLVSRALLEIMPDHNVDTFISLSSPQGGQFGITEVFRDILPSRLSNVTKEELYRFLYTEGGQLISIGGYWYDPKHLDLFDLPDLNVFLAAINNQTVNETKSQEHKNNFLRLKNLVLIGGPDDGVITPWQSSHFSTFDKNGTVLPMEKQQWYLRDSFGLQTLNSQGRVHMYSVPGVFHTHWHGNKMVFYKCIEKWLT